MQRRPRGPDRLARFVDDPVTGATAELRPVRGDAAHKAYRCPGCNQGIAPGTTHVVVVPLADATQRRHWHRACWDHRHRRRPGH
ncbi:MAG: hypothetical protein M0T71_05280 [Actinomycetota bacterium]|nr:hypothetical protein [Actinomycetota bacterium]